MQGVKPVVPYITDNRFTEYLHNRAEAGKIYIEIYLNYYGAMFKAGHIKLNQIHSPAQHIHANWLDSEIISGLHHYLHINIFNGLIDYELINCRRYIVVVTHSAW